MAENACAGDQLLENGCAGDELLERSLKSGCGYKGVSRCRNKWRYQKDGKYIGTFATAAEAADTIYDDRRPRPLAQSMA